MTNGQTVTLPDIGDYRDVPVIEIHVAPGDIIAVNDTLVTIESDKATIEAPSPLAGTIREVLVSLGTKVSRGSAIVIIEPSVIDETGPLSNPSDPTTDRPAETAIPEEDPRETPAPPPGPAPQPPRPQSSPDRRAADQRPAHASPSVRQLARELGVDLSKVAASGPKGRILKSDVQAFVKRALSAPAGAGVGQIGADLPPWPAIDFSRFGPVEKQAQSRIRRISAANLSRNWLRIPHVTNFDRADITDLETFRKEVNEETGADGVRLTMTAFLIKASASALRKFPRFNASLEGNDLVLKSYVHIGFAADTPDGLIVPVIRDCDQKGVFQIARELTELATKARGGGMTASDLQGGCFTVSSLGGTGGDGFTPIINAPEVAILGSGRANIQPSWNGSSFEPRLIVPISLSWDHRVIDGVGAARFLGHVATVLGDFRRALL
ncbi:MAG: 2-oxo acid dehydrogenase subunit E2 [Alphaproteobacteria bacterium]|nr:2-oxo acid dehydrogenase subunit E2 [Alphaproteobacteria bacterium]